MPMVLHRPMEVLCPLSMYFIMIEFRNFSILSWNIRGAANKKSKIHLKNLIRKFKPTDIFLMETHVSFDKTESFWRSVGFKAVSVVEAHGQAGGLLVMVDTVHDYDILMFIPVIFQLPLRLGKMAKSGFVLLFMLALFLLEGLIYGTL